MPYRITLDPVDPTIARASRRIHHKIPLYVPLATRSRPSVVDAIDACAFAIEADRKARAERAKAARSLLAWISGLFGPKGE
uniref:hypothetical protein n=1 Tax=Ruegeria arenilitoris TaxID=1173585 RepID=UPI00147E03F8|nr:hypothetical protein [Ruegeria arenilitoris]